MMIHHQQKQGYTNSGSDQHEVAVDLRELGWTYEPIYRNWIYLNRMLSGKTLLCMTLITSLYSTPEIGTLINYRFTGDQRNTMLDAPMSGGLHGWLLPPPQCGTQGIAATRTQLTVITKHQKRESTNKFIKFMSRNHQSVQLTIRMFIKSIKFIN